MFGDQVAYKIKEFNYIKIFLMSAYEFDIAVIDSMKKNDYIAGFLRNPFKIWILSAYWSKNLHYKRLSLWPAMHYDRQ
jgi:hypothetical protein